MADFIIAIVLLLIIGAALAYIIKEKKRGTRCIGCPAGGSCSHAAGGCGGCNGHAEGTQEGCSCSHTDVN